MTAPARHARRAVSAFVVIAIAVGAVLSLCAVWLADTITRADFVQDAEETARQVQQAVITSLTEGSRAREEELFAELLLPQVQAGTLSRVKVWRRTDASNLLLVYSDRPDLIGQEKRLRPDRAEIIGTTGTLAVPVPDDPVHRTELVAGSDLIEVFTAFSSGGDDYLLESCFVSSASVKAARLRDQLLPVLLGGMLLFACAVLPLAISLARRLGAAERDRAALVARATAERDEERAKLGRHLHDGLIQDLAGATLALSTLAASPRPDPARIGAVADVLRRDVRAVRSLLDGLVPTDLTWDRLEDALRAVAADEGLDTRVEVTPRPRADGVQTALLFRGARELLVNVARHARAQRVIVSASCSAGAAVLTVEDDGLGFDPDAAPETGHVGLRLVRHAVAAAGGELTVSSAPGRGTSVRISVPRTSAGALSRRLTTGGVPPVAGVSPSGRRDGPRAGRACDRRTATPVAARRAAGTPAAPASSPDPGR